MENQVTNEAIENVAETTIEKVSEVVPTIKNKDLAYIAVGAGAAVLAVVAVKKCKKALQERRKSKNDEAATVTFEESDIFE